MTTTTVLYTGDGVTRQFAVPFPYIAQAHVIVRVNGVPLVPGAEFVFVNPGLVELRLAQSPNAAIEIARETPIDGPLVQFQNGAVLNERDLNLAVLQTLYLLQETRSALDSTVTAGLRKVAGSAGIVGTTADEIIASVTDTVLGSALLNNLQSRLSEIDTNAQSILSTNNNLAAEISRVDTLTATVNNNNTTLTASVQTEQTARVNGDNALATSVNTVQTQVNGNTATIQQQATTLNGLSAQYTVKVDLNGYVTGFGLASTAINGVPTSSFTILADKFSIVTPGSQPVVPFAVDAQGVYMNTAYIRTLVVDKIAGGAVNAQWGFYNGGGRIVLDTGTYMKVIGVGFGANNDLLEWFGPKMAVTACTKANATTYVGTNGDAYFGGSLRAGALYNSRQSSDISTGVSLPLGPFGSNGAAIAVVLSYSFVNSWYTTTNNGTGSTPQTAVIDLYQTVGSGAEVKVATLTATGTTDWWWDFELQKTNYSTRVSGSLTFTDSLLTTAQRTYRAYLVSRTYGYNGLNVSQSIGLTSTEQ